MIERKFENRNFNIRIIKFMKRWGQPKRICKDNDDKNHHIQNGTFFQFNYYYWYILIIEQLTWELINFEKVDTRNHCKGVYLALKEHLGFISISL